MALSSNVHINVHSYCRSKFLRYSYKNIKIFGLSSGWSALRRANCHPLNLPTKPKRETIYKKVWIFIRLAGRESDFTSKCSICSSEYPIHLLFQQADFLCDGWRTLQNDVRITRARCSHRARRGLPVTRVSRERRSKSLVRAGNKRRGASGRCAALETS